MRYLEIYSAYDQLVPNLNSLYKRFKEHHFSIIDLIDKKDEASLVKEQDTLDAHDKELSILLLGRIVSLRRPVCRGT